MSKFIKWFKNKLNKDKQEIKRCCICRWEGILYLYRDQYYDIACLDNLLLNLKGRTGVPQHTFEQVINYQPKDLYYE